MFPGDKAPDGRRVERIFITGNHDWDAYTYDGGVFVNPFVPPGVPEGHALIRTSFMATHTPDLVEAAADVIAEALGC